MAEEKALALGLKPLAIISGIGKGGCAPEMMGESPVPAVHNMLENSGKKLSDYERIECNEVCGGRRSGGKVTPCTVDFVLSVWDGAHLELTAE